MAVPVELDPRAEAEAREAFRWYLDRSPRAAEAFERELTSAIEQIGESPATFPVIDDGIRRFMLDRFPYSVLYSIGRANVCVVAVAHQHRKPGHWRGR
jgi:plasmid stabilization system protein ParE